MSDLPKLSILVSARKNSKYLAKFLAGFWANFGGHCEVELIIMLNEADTWNDDVITTNEMIARLTGPMKTTKVTLTVCREDLGLGRAGLHEYFNLLVAQSTGDWVIYFCEDHYFAMRGWDQIIMDYIYGRIRSGDSDKLEFPLNSAEPWIIVPQFDNAGPMNHIVSRGFIEAMDGKIGNHGWIDSYLNDLGFFIPDRVVSMNAPAIFHDFTHDVPNPMSDAHSQSVLSEEGKKLPKYRSKEYDELLLADKLKIKKALEGLNANENDQQN